MASGLAALLETDPLVFGHQMHALMTELYPLCRSITGDGVRQTHAVLRRHIPLESHEVPSGTKVFDWTIPREWNIRDAYIIAPDGNKIVDFRKSNLHVVSYSAPVRATMSLGELKPHLWSLREKPEVIPYVTSYYEERWGFCITHRQLEALEEGEYEVCIDSTLESGRLTYGELLLPGKTPDEVLISTYTCHPSMCNDNLSGVVLATILAKALGGLSLRYSYRFLFIPETIGSITWLARNQDRIHLIKHGLVATCVGDGGHLTYKKSRRGDAEIDRSVQHVLRHCGEPYEVLEFFPSGSDERQFCSPGFDLPVGALMRTPYGRFPEYHTSGDRPELVKPQYLADSFAKYLAVIHVLEHNRVYWNVNPKCEPQLGRRGLYRTLGGSKSSPSEDAIRWVLNLSDGNHDLLAIAERSGLAFGVVQEAAEILCDSHLLSELELVTT